MNGRLTLVAFHHMTCGCKVDTDAAYLLVCPMHLHAQHLLEGLKRLEQALAQPALREQAQHLIQRAEGRC